MATLTIQDDDTSAIDAMINNSSPNNNFGTTNYMNIGKYLTAGDVGRYLNKPHQLPPAGSMVSAVSLTITQTGDYSNADQTLYAYKVTRDWGEGARDNSLAQSGECSWNHNSYPNTWATAGAVGTGDIDTTAVGSRAFSASEANGAKEITLSAALAQGWVDSPSTNRGVLLKIGAYNASEGSNSQYGFDSSASATAANRPKWVFTYTEAGGGQPMQLRRNLIPGMRGF